MKLVLGSIKQSFATVEKMSIIGNSSGPSKRDTMLGEVGMCEAVELGVNKSTGLMLPGLESCQERKNV